MSVPTVSPINQMLAAGPDKYSNQFSVFISRVPRDNYTSMENDGSTPDFNTSWMVFSDYVDETDDVDATPIIEKMKKLISVSQNSQDIKVRTIDIEIPLPKYNNFQTPFYNTQVERTATKLTYTNKSVLNIELDNSLIYLDAFQELAGHKNYALYEDDSEYESLNAARNINLPKDYIYNIYVVSNPLKNAKSNFSSDYIDSNAPLYYWEFYDCRFLGNENEIKFDKSSNVISGSFPFIFFDCRTKFGG